MWRFLKDSMSANSFRNIAAGPWFKAWRISCGVKGSPAVFTRWNIIYFTSNGVPLRNVFMVILSDLIRLTSGRAN